MADEPTGGRARGTGAIRPEKLMVARLDDLIAYRDALIAYLADRNDPDLAPFIHALERIDMEGERRPQRPKPDHPAMAHLETALGSVKDPNALAAARTLDWLPVFSGGGIDPVLANGMFAAQLAGNYGRFPSTEISTGLFLLTPGVAYPLHTHAALEVYSCLSGVLRLQHGVDGTPFDLKPGQYSITPYNRLHALTVEDTPVLLAYVWVGDLGAPNWWWTRDKDGSWQRTAWVRKPGEPFKPVRTEPVTPEIMAEAHINLSI